MTSQTLFSFLGGGGVVSVVLALLSWARGKNNDQANVAKNWESGVSMLLRSAEGQVGRLNQDLARMQRKLDETNARLSQTREQVVDLQRETHVLRNILEDALTDLENRKADTQPYRDRVAKLRAV